MSRNTGNTEVIKNLQNALEAFLKDHRKHAETDPEWVADPGEMPQSGCGCKDCEYAGYLLGRI